MIEKRAAGILLHPTSLPSPFGIGDLGQGAYDFVDFLQEAGQSYWQILPLEPLGGGNSPYASCSAFAKNILLISPEKLLEKGLLTKEDIETPPVFDHHKVEYDLVNSYKTSLFKKLFMNFKDLPTSLLAQFKTFCSNHSFWLDDYSLYISIKEFYKGEPWITWPDSLKNRNPKALNNIKIQLKDSINYHKFSQFIFFLQWQELKEYANSRGIKIIGDIPIFVSYDSVEVWSQPKLFDLNKKGFPTEVSGVPPDYFSAEGQLWGNPLYNWDYHDQTDYKWWRMRLRYILKYVDLARIDHFRGLESYWAVPIESKTAISGKWKKAPGYKLFESFIEELGELPIIAEDLGTLTKEVHELRDTFDLAGMAILQFAFENNNKNPYLPHNCSLNTVLYTGTHDNDTLLAWYETSSPSLQDHVRSYINSDDSDIVWKMIRLAYTSICNTVIIPMQDIQQLGSQARMNVPGLATGNWEWRYTKDMINPSMTLGLNYLCNLYTR